MAKLVNAIPEGYHSITPSLTCRSAAQAIEFYKKAFGAQELRRMASPDGKVSHAELKIGDSVLMLNDEFTSMSAAPTSTTPPSSYLFLYVADVDAVFSSAIQAGARVEMPVQDMFWGDRYGKLTDPAGHQWGIATHLEDVAPEEMGRRAAAFFAKAAGQS
jgi:PhnB protein